MTLVDGITVVDNALNKLDDSEEKNDEKIKKKFMNVLGKPQNEKTHKLFTFSI